MAKATELGIEDLAEILDELQGRFPKLAEDDLFVLWFLRAYITENEKDAGEAVTGGPGDKSIDGVFVDHRARTAFLVQAKHRKSIGIKTEARSDVLAFAEVAQRVCDPDEDGFKSFVADMEPYTAERIKAVRECVWGQKYRLRLFYVTLGKVTAAVQKDAIAVMRRTKRDAALEFLGGRRCMVILRDYLDGVAPPIPTLDLEMESSPKVRVNGVANRFDHEAGIESWVFSMSGDAVGDLYEQAGVRLFARNIRGFLGGSTAVNEGMVKTLKTEPEKFFYYNNGVTIICDAAEKKSSKGRDILQVSNPQVINGQQTTRTLAAERQHAGRGSVLVKVICVPRDEKADGYDDLVSRIVAGTNWQNAIKPSDLMSNDRRQIELERELRKFGYLYLRKRQTKGEARLLAGGKHYRIIKKEELAQAVAGCELDPSINRSGREHLFEEGLYEQVFSNTDPEYYLSRYWMMRAVTYGARGKPQRGYAKWMVLNFLWNRDRDLLKGKRRQRAFRVLSERKASELITPLGRAVDKIFADAIGYYRANRGTGESQLDISLFFRHRKGHHREFEAYWVENAKASEIALTKSLEAVSAALDGFEE